MSTTSIRITSGTILRTILFAGLAVLLYKLLHVVLVALTAVVIASAIEPGVEAFVRYGLPRVLSVVLIYAALIGGFVLFAVFLLPPLIADVAELIAQAPGYIRSLQLDSTIIGQQVSATSQSLSLSDIVANLQNLSLESTRDILGFASKIFGGVFNFFLIATLSFYLAARENGVEDFLHLVTPSEHEAYVVDLWHRTRVKIGQWLQGQIVLMVIVGLLVYVGLSILSIPNAALLGFVAGAFEIIPIFGPVLSAIPAIALAGLSGGLSLALLAGGLFVIVQQIENNIIHPLVFNKVVGLSPIVVILSIVIGGQLAGFLGVLLAVPLAAGLMELIHDVNYAKHTEGVGLEDGVESSSRDAK